MAEKQDSEPHNYSEAAIEIKQQKKKKGGVELNALTGTVVYMRAIAMEVQYCTPHKVYNSQKHLHFGKESKIALFLFFLFSFACLNNC